MQAAAMGRVMGRAEGEENRNDAEDGEAAEAVAGGFQTGEGFRGYAIGGDSQQV